MALTFRYQPKEMGGPVETVTIDRHWYLTEDKQRVVPEGSLVARSLWATPGMDVPRAEAERLGAVEPLKPEPESSAAEPESPAVEPDEPAEEVKAAPKPADKQRAKPGDKSATVPDLRKQAADLGVQVDNRWGAERLRQEIAGADPSEG